VIFDSWVAVSLMMGPEEHLIAVPAMTSKFVEGPPQPTWFRSGHLAVQPRGLSAQAAAVAPIANRPRCPRPRPATVVFWPLLEGRADLER